MNRISILFIMWAFYVGGLLNAIAADSIKSSTTPDMKSSTAATMSDGEIMKIEKDAGKITIKHGPLANFNMPAMTMVFRVKDPAMLEQVKSGDKVKFIAEKLDGALTVTTLQANN